MKSIKRSSGQFADEIADASRRQDERSLLLVDVNFFGVGRNEQDEIDERRIGQEDSCRVEPEVWMTHEVQIQDCFHFGSKFLITAANRAVFGEDVILDGSTWLFSC